MGEHMTNLPTRFPADTLSLIVRESAFHKMKPSQYVREAMKKWFRMVADGTVQFLDTSMQEEHSRNCEQREQSLQIEFPSAVESPETLLGKKPPVRVQVKVGANRGREFRSVSQRRAVGAGVRLAWLCPPFRATSSPLKSNSFRRVA